MSQPVYIPALTGIRAIAAGMVFVGHMLDKHKPEVPDILEYGWTGVNIFFALSGYLFTHIYADAILELRFSWKSYLQRRLFRIYPLTTLVVIVSALSTVGQYSVLDVTLHLLLLHSWVPEFRMTLNSPLWTLTLEEAYYLAAPILIYVLARIQRDFQIIVLSRVPSRVKELLFVGFIVAIVYVSDSLSDGLTRQYQRLIHLSFGTWDSGVWTFSIFGRLDDFISGMIAACCARYFLPRRKYFGDIIVLVGVLVYLLVLQYIATHGGPNGVGKHLYGQYAFKLLAIAASIVFYGLHVGGVISRILGSKPAVLLGEASFALYLIQFMPFIWWPNIGIAMQRWLEELGINFWFVAIIAYVVFNVLSIFVYYTYERNFTQWLRRRYQIQSGS